MIVDILTKLGEVVVAVLVWIRTALVNTGWVKTMSTGYSKILILQSDHLMVGS